jgi:cytochrome oxidase Cu insertion factor (SCO1/SenC/PrrC family)
VNLSGLKAKLSGSPSTMSFMFAACGDVCPTTASVLHSVSKARPDLRHVIVSLSPIDDFTGKKLESIVNAQGLKTSGAHANTIILYPTSDGSTTPRALMEGNKAGFDVQHKLELWTQGRDVSGHSGVITLFDANGKQLVQAMNNRDSTPMVKTLTQALAAQPTASR